MTEDLDTPNCPACLVRMEPREVNLAVLWECPRAA